MTTMMYGLPLWKITPRLLTPVPVEFAENPGLAVPDARERFFAWLDALSPKVKAKFEYEAYIDREYLHNNWKDRWHDIPAWAVIDALGLDDAIRLMAGDIIQSRVWEYIEALMSAEWRSFRDRDRAEPIEKGHPLSIWKKVTNSLWRYSFENDYNRSIALYERLRTFEFGAGFEVTLDHASYHNERGSAWFHRSMPDVEDPEKATLFLDGAFAYCVYLKGAHALTIGFSFSRQGVLLQQVQLRQKKGNRWLYKLRDENGEQRSLLEHVISCMQRAFPEERLLLIDGQDAALRIRKAFDPKNLTAEHAAKIDAAARVYDQPLAGYERGRPESVFDARYRELRPKAQHAKCA